MTDLPDLLRAIVGPRYVLTTPRAMERYCNGFRSGGGEALAVVRPGSLVEQWKVLQACVEADVVVIFQAANTGLTEGSTPNGTYDRDAVVVSTTRMDAIHMLNSGEQVVSLPGATLFDLEKQLAPMGRQPHSVIGSSCIGRPSWAACAIILVGRWLNAGHPIPKCQFTPKSRLMGS